MLRSYCVLRWSPRDIDRTASSSQQSLNGTSKDLWTCFPCYLPWLTLVSTDMGRGDPLGKSLCHQNWWPLFEFWDPLSGKKELIPPPVVLRPSQVCCGMYRHSCTHKDPTGSWSQEVALVRIIRVKSPGTRGPGFHAPFLPTSACAQCQTGYRSTAQERLSEDAPQTWGTSPRTTYNK